KMSDLYSKIANSYDKPSRAELDNLKLLESRLDKAKADFAKLKKKVKVNDLNLKTYKEFLAE
ncbi:MAG: hypothetical protein KAT78_06750, partial [Flavobacteriaceae bacterium]|nr:hypothetical protein [Flavobacteriaceae bacterium]